MHASAQGDRIELLRHRGFIASRLLLSLAALVCLPLYLAVYGAPPLFDALIFALSMGPLAASMLTMRTGNLFAGQVICVVSILCLASVLTIGAAPIAIAAMIWLALAPMEAYLTSSAKTVLATGSAALGIALLTLVLKLSGYLYGTAQVSLAASTTVVLIAIGYATMLALGALEVSEFRHKFSAIRQSRYQCLSEAIGDLVINLDRSGAVISVSGNSEDLFGLPQRELHGRGMFDRVHVADRPAFLKAIADASKGHEVVTVVLRLRVPDHKSGEQDAYFAWIELRANKMRLDDAYDGQIAKTAVIAVVRDITHKKEYEQELKIAQQEAERANLWKDRFLANVSHELRTPLNAIIGFAEILASPEMAPADPSKSQEYAQIIRDSGEHLLSVVNSILDISKIEAGSFDIVPEGFEVSSVVEHCMDMLQLRAEKGGVTIAQDKAQANLELIADKRAVKQIIINLLSNAIKFTPEGGSVTIGCKPEGNSVLLWVRDTGIGIVENELSQIGDPFFQASDTYNRSYEGTGLGLSVVRGLVGLHGGAIRIESAPNAGTCVSVKLPLDCRQAGIDVCSSAKIEAIILRPAKLQNVQVKNQGGVRKIA